MELSFILSWIIQVRILPIQSAITVAKLLLTLGLGYSTVHFKQST